MYHRNRQAALLRVLERLCRPKNRISLINWIDPCAVRMWTSTVSSTGWPGKSEGRRAPSKRRSNYPTLNTPSKLTGIALPRLDEFRTYCYENQINVPSGLLHGATA